MTKDEEAPDLALSRTLRAALREESPGQLLTLASTMVSLYRQPDFPDAIAPTELSFDDAVDPDHSFAELLEMFLDVDSFETTGLLHALDVLVNEEGHHARIRAELDRRRGPMPVWAQQLAHARIPEPCYSLTQYAGDFQYYLFAFDVPGSAPMSVSVAIDLIAGGVVEDVAFGESDLERMVEIARSSGDELLPPETIDPAQLRVILESAMWLGRHMIPEPESESWPHAEALLAWWCRLLPEGGEVAEPEYSDEHVEKFLASAHSRGLAPRVLEWADSVFDLAMDYHSGDPTRWSPARVEEMLWIIARRFMAPDDTMLKFPALLKAIVGWAAEQTNAPEKLVRATLAAVDEVEPEYRDHILDSPADPFFEEDEAWLNDLRERDGGRYLELLAEDVGGQEALDALDTEPLPTEELDLREVPEDIHDRVRSWWGHIDTYIEAENLRGFDPETVTVYARVLRQLAQRSPAVFRRRGSDVRGAAATIALAHELNQTGIPATWVQRFFDLSSGLTDRLNTLRKALGPRSPRLLTSIRREEILHEVAFWRNT